MPNSGITERRRHGTICLFTDIITRIDSRRTRFHARIIRTIGGNIEITLRGIRFRRKGNVIGRKRRQGSIGSKQFCIRLQQGSCFFISTTVNTAGIPVFRKRNQRCPIIGKERQITLADSLVRRNHLTVQCIQIGANCTFRIQAPIGIQSGLDVIAIHFLSIRTRDSIFISAGNHRRSYDCQSSIELLHLCFHSIRSSIMSAGCLRTDGSIDLAKLRLDRIARGEIITRLLRTYSCIQFLQLRFDAVSGRIVISGLLRADRGIQSRDIGCGRIGRFCVIRAGHRTQFRVRRPAGQNTGIPTCHSAGRRRRNLVAAVDRNIRPRRVTTAGTNATNLESSPIIVILHRHRAISTHCIRRVLDVICKNLTAGNKSRIAGRNRAGRQRREHRTIDRFDHIRRCSAGSRRKRNRLRCRRRLRTHFRDLRFDIIRSRVQRSIRRLRRTEFRIQFL